MKSFNLSGRVAIVTGGSKGLGKAIVLALAEAGAHTVVVSRHLGEAERVSREGASRGPESLAIEADITQPAQVSRMVRETLARFGKIDILVNNAGINLRKPVLDFETEDWNRILDTNVIACYMCSREVCGHMLPRKKGNIINIASLQASVVVPGRGVYGASKAAMVQLTRYFAVELAPHGIRANAICAGPFETEMVQKMTEQEGSYDSLAKKVPMKRIGQPPEIGGAVIYLASDASSFVTGATLYIDGGWSAA